MLKNAASKQLHIIRGPMFMHYTHPQEVNTLLADFFDSLTTRPKD
jgi:hypothetical protein